MINFFEEHTLVLLCLIVIIVVFLYAGVIRIYSKDKKKRLIKFFLPDTTFEQGVPAYIYFLDKTVRITPHKIYTGFSNSKKEVNIPISTITSVSYVYRTVSPTKEGLKSPFWFEAGIIHLFFWWKKEKVTLVRVEYLDDQLQKTYVDFVNLELFSSTKSLHNDLLNLLRPMSNLF